MKAKPKNVYHVQIITDVTVHNVPIYKTVFADNEKDAKIQVEKVTKAAQTHELQKIIRNWTRQNTDAKVIACSLEHIKPMDDPKKRMHVTNAQCTILSNMLLNGGVKAQIIHSASLGGWRTLKGAGSGYTRVEEATIISMYRKNLIEPIEIDAAELQLQNALGTMVIREFTFQLNMKEILRHKLMFEGPLRSLGLI